MGLGHIRRDIAVIDSLRKLIPDVEVIWLTAQPNISVLKETGEAIHPLSYDMQSPTEAAENIAQSDFQYESRHNYKLIQKIQRQNATLVSKALLETEPNLVFCDESAEVMWVLAKNPELKKWPLVFLTDSLYPAPAEPLRSLNPLQRWKAYDYRRKYLHYMQKFKNSGFEPYLMLYIGSIEEIPNKSMGPGLPQLRSFFLQHFQPIGYIVPFDSDALRREGRANLKSRLGYSLEKKLIVVSVGGVGIGREFLERVDRAAPALTEVVGGALEIVFVCGPRLPTETVHVTSGIVSVRGYVPNLYEHFAAADFAIIKAGLSSAVELMAVATPFLYVPAPGIVEEEYEVSSRLQHLGVGQELNFSEMTPENLANVFRRGLKTSSQVHEVHIPTNGAEVVAKLIQNLLTGGPRSSLQSPTPRPAALSSSASKKSDGST